MERIEKIEKGVESLERVMRSKYMEIKPDEIDLCLMISDIKYLLNELKKLQTKSKGGKKRSNDKTRNKN